MHEDTEQMRRALGYHICALARAVELLAGCSGVEPEQIRIQLWRHALTRQGRPSAVEAAEAIASFKTAEAINLAVFERLAREYTPVGEA